MTNPYNLNQWANAAIVAVLVRALLAISEEYKARALLLERGVWE